MKKGKLFLGYAAIFIATMILVFPAEVILRGCELIVRAAINAVEALSETVFFCRNTAAYWLKVSYLGIWILKALASWALISISCIGWEIQCVRWNAKKK